jgi:N-acetyl-beta-hexosaminidase
MMRLAALLLGLATSAPSADIYPPPQQYHPLSGQVALTGWPVGSDDASAARSARLIADLLQSFGPSPLAGLPTSHFIAVGLLDASTGPSSAFATLAKKHNVTASDPALREKEGYVLTISESGVVLAAQTPAGLFFGYQSLRQLVASGSAPACHVSDWPDFPLRGAYRCAPPPLHASD